LSYYIRVALMYLWKYKQGFKTEVVAVAGGDSCSQQCPAQLSSAVHTCLAPVTTAARNRRTSQMCAGEAIGGNNQGFGSCLQIDAVAALMMHPLCFVTTVL
jgi:hypothetical protein